MFYLVLLSNFPLMSNISRFKFLLALALFLLLALGLRLLHLGEAPFWADEGVSFQQEDGGPFVQCQYKKIPQLPGDPPGYHLLMRLIFRGHWEKPYSNLDRTYIRLLSALAGVAAVLFLALLMNSIAGREGALVAAALLSFSIYGIYYSQEHRPYELWVAWSILTTWLFVVVFFRRRLRLAPLLGLALGMLLYSNYGAIFLPAVYLFTFLLVAAFRMSLPGPEEENPNPIGRRDLYAALVVVAVALLVFLPIRNCYLGIAFNPVRFNPIAALIKDPPIFLKLKTELLYSSLLHFGAGKQMSLLTYLPLAVFGWLGIWRRHRPAAVLFGSFYLVTFIVTTVFAVCNTLQPRHLMFLFPIHQALAAYGIVTIGGLSSNRRIKWMLIVGLVVSLLILNVVALQFYYAHSVKCDSARFLDFCQMYIDIFDLNR